MNIKKFILLLFFCFFVSGCSVDYNLEISNDGFFESFDIIASEEEKFIEYVIPIYYGVMGYEVIGSNFLDKQDGIIYYDSNVQKKGNIFKFNYNYKFENNEFSRSNIVNSAYDTVIIKEYDYDDNGEDDYMLLSTSDNFLLFDKFEQIDSIKINISCGFDVISSNADEVTNGVYTWHMTPDNVKAINMVYNPDKVVDYRSFWNKILDGDYLTIFIVFLSMLVLGIIIYLFVKFKEKRVNEV